MDIALKGAILNQDPRSMIDQSRIGITRPAVDRVLVLEYEAMLTRKSWKLSRSQCLRLSVIEISKARLLPDGSVPQILSTSGLEGLRVMSTSSPSIVLTRTTTGGMAVKKLTSSRSRSPPWGLRDQKPPSNDDCPDFVITRTKGVSINDLESVRSTIGLKLTKMLKHILPVGESNLQGDSNSLRSHEAGGCVDNDGVEDLVSTVYILSMGSLEVGLNWREVLEHRHVEVMLISVRICRQEPQVYRIQI